MSTNRGLICQYVKKLQFLDENNENSLVTPYILTTNSLF